MMIYLITYDLNLPGQDYNDIHEGIKNLAGSGNWIHPLESVWCIKTSLTGSDIRDSLKPDYNDKLIVVQVSGGWATNFKNSDTDWLEART